MSTRVDVVESMKTRVIPPQKNSACDEVENEAPNA